MPHLVLEYSANVSDPPNFDRVLERLHRALQESFSRAHPEGRCDVTVEVREMHRDLDLKAAPPPAPGAGGGGLTPGI